MSGFGETLSPFILSGRKKPEHASKTFYKTEYREVKQINDRISKGGIEEDLSTSGRMGHRTTLNPGLSTPECPRTWRQLLEQARLGS